MKEDLILKELRNILNVSNEDIPKTLSRFKREIEEMRKEIE